MPNIGYGSSKHTRLPLKKRFLLEMLLMHNEKYATEIAHSVGVKKRKEIVERAYYLRPTVTNRFSGLHAEENE